jgi:hypothetical protein
LENDMYTYGFCATSTAATIDIWLRPVRRSSMPNDSAASPAAQAAEVDRLVPPRSNWLATRPAITLGSRPGKESSVHSGSCAITCSGTSRITMGSSERRQ